MRGVAEHSNFAFVNVKLQLVRGAPACNEIDSELDSFGCSLFTVVRGPDRNIVRIEGDANILGDVRSHTVDVEDEQEW
jgi:hypothetical protein